MDYFGAFPNLELALMERGWSLAYLQNHNRRGTDDDSDANAGFVDLLADEFGLARKCACVGMSCVGICSVNFASRHPNCGHHPHGLEDSAPLADFIETYAL